MFHKKLAWTLTAASLVMKRVISACACTSFLFFALSSVVAADDLSSDDQNSYIVGGRHTDEQTYKAAQAVSDGLTLLNNNQLIAALQKLQYAVRLDPALPEAHHNLGYVLSKLGKTDEAIAQYNKAIELHDNTESAWLSLGGLYQSTGQIDPAIQTLQGFLKRFPSSTQYHKIYSLVQGLKEEREQQLLQGGTINQAASSSDYFTAATMSGVARWTSKSMPIAVYIADGNRVPFYRPEFAVILQRAFTDWASASQGLISFVFVGNLSQAAINCTWTNDPSALSNAAEAGEATITKENGYIVKADIKILTVPLSPELPLTANRMNAFCLHEIGHALGIEGHSLNPADIMYSSAVLSDSPRDLSVRDRNTILRLYSRQLP